MLIVVAPSGSSLDWKGLLPVAKRLAKRQPMPWSSEVAHSLLQTPTKVLNSELRPNISGAVEVDFALSIERRLLSQEGILGRR